MHMNIPGHQISFDERSRLEDTYTTDGGYEDRRLWDNEAVTAELVALSAGEVVPGAGPAGDDPRFSWLYDSAVQLRNGAVLEFGVMVEPGDPEEGFDHDFVLEFGWCLYDGEGNVLDGDGADVEADDDAFLDVLQDLVSICSHYGPFPGA